VWGGSFLSYGKAVYCSFTAKFRLMIEKMVLLRINAPGFGNNNDR
jgi:hypothetical protein